MQIIKIAEFKIRKEKLKECMTKIYRFAQRFENNPNQDEEYQRLDKISYIHFMVDTQKGVN